MSKHPWCVMRDGQVYAEGDPVRDMYGVWHLGCWEQAQAVRREGTDARQRRLKLRMNRPIKQTRKEKDQ